MSVERLSVGGCTWDRRYSGWLVHTCSCQKVWGKTVFGCKAEAEAEAGRWGDVVPEPRPDPRFKVGNDAWLVRSNASGRRYYKIHIARQSFDGGVWRYSGGVYPLEGQHKFKEVAESDMYTADEMVAL